MKSTLERFYEQIAPWLNWHGQNDAALLAAANNLEGLVEAAKTLPNLILQPDAPLTAHRNLAMEKALPQALATERKELIGEITGGKSTFAVRTKFGNRKVFDSTTGEELQFSNQGGRKRSTGSWWDSATQDQIRALHAQVTEERRLSGLSREEIRQEFKPQRPQAPQTKPVESSDGYQLINPATMQEYSKAELLHFLNHGGKGAATELLVHKDSRTVNQRAVARLREILSGVSR